MAGAQGGMQDLWGQIQRDGHVSNIFHYPIDMRRERYAHPITGTMTYYIPTGVVVITGTNNSAIGREMIECEPCHVDAASGIYGMYLSSYEENEAPGGFRISLEWTGLPMIGVDCGQYVYTDVTNT